MSLAVAVVLARALDLFAAARDIVAERVDSPASPGWAVARGWERFLLGLEPAEVDRAESAGLATVLASHPDAPADLGELARAVGQATAVEPIAAANVGPFCGTLRKVSPPKRRQLEGVLALCAPLVSRGSRVVDVGSGHGHLARWMGEAYGVPVLGLERVADRVAAARRLGALGGRVLFDVADLGVEPLPLGPRDLAVGLHACGELGDELIGAAARARSTAVLVGCCFQKIRGRARAPLSGAARRAGFVLDREHLGLANLTVRPMGVAGSLADTLRARERRLALRRLLEARGIDVAAGAEMRGLNRRKAYGDLERMAREALAARGAAAPGPGELERACAEAARDFSRIRRLSLPRNMLARLLEVTLAADRAGYLEECGFDVRLVLPFPMDASPRNIAVVATAA